ncbi:hypothetical protein IQ254_03410 [Nodosilinea sp. LEGE 07088]|uniref:hypothetical protein n=1 Tax=Nodosilinea sp. LEGE 07088 TaxID=2777968 RepID=UPI0018800581|nr:hypothetical protein [Nodosilinea sp. LEGE 07088]MBE9136258.1 hypothetical protein [Nodosilinea sp. LEGE 07088]
MGIQLNHISGLTLSLLTALALAAPSGQAQEATVQTIPDALDDLTSTYSGDYFENRTITRQFNRIIGFGFPERELEWDGNGTSAAVRDILLLQTTADPTIRVPDLVNPYTTTLLTMPSDQTPYVGSEFIFESF